MSENEDRRKAKHEIGQIMHMMAQLSMLLAGAFTMLSIAPPPTPAEKRN